MPATPSQAGRGPHAPHQQRVDLHGSIVIKTILARFPVVTYLHLAIKPITCITQLLESKRSTSS